MQAATPTGAIHAATTQSPRGGSLSALMTTSSLATWEMRFVGLSLALPDQPIQLPQGVPFQIPVSAWVGTRKAASGETRSLVPSDATLVGLFSGPGIGSVEVRGRMDSGLSMPPMPQAGSYTLSSVRLVQGGRTLAEALPQVLTLTCFGEVLISQVSSVVMSQEEIRSAGLKLGPGSYEARRFTLAVAIGSNAVTLSVPIATPVYNGLDDPRNSAGEIGRLELSGLAGAKVPDLQVSVASLAPETDPFLLTRPGISHRMRQAFKALVVIPGSIGYLHQFYRVNVVVLNTLPEGSPYEVDQLTAIYAPPPAADGVGPLRLASNYGEGVDDSARKPVLGPDEQGKVGQGQPRLKAGESGLATFFLEALHEGSHPANFLIQGQFQGPGLDRPVPLQGQALGRILVKNPTFDLLLVHPEVVRKGETFTLEARLTNTSGTLANQVSLSLDRARLGNVKLVGDPVQQVEEIRPGESASFKFTLRALRDGEVRGSYLYIEEGGIGFQLSVGLGERNIRLNPDTLVLPQTLLGAGGLPEPLTEAILRVLGQAYSIATSKGALPPGVLPIPRGLVTDQAAALLSEQGVFLRMGADPARIWWALNRFFLQNPDPGFDQLMRSTEAGAELKNALLAAWRNWASRGTALEDRLAELAAMGEGLDGMGMASVEGARSGLRIEVEDAQGSHPLGVDASLPTDLIGASWAKDGTRRLVQFPASGTVRLILSNQGAEAMDLDLATVLPGLSESGGGFPESRFNLHLGAGVSARLDLDSGTGVMARLHSAAGAFLEQVAPGSVGTRTLEPFQVLAVHRKDPELFPDSEPWGTQVMVLFNRPNAAIRIGEGEEGFQQAQALIQVEANQFWRKKMGYAEAADGGSGTGPDGRPLRLPSPAALIQAFPSVLTLYLEKPVGPILERHLTLSEAWQDRHGRVLAGSRTWPIRSGWIPGGAVVRGKVRKVDGTGIPAELSLWYFSKVTSSEALNLASNQTFTSEEKTEYYALITNQVATEADGSYQLDYVPEPVGAALGPFVIQADVPGQGQAFAEASILGNGQTLQMDVLLEGKGSVEGFVVDAQGRPVPGARVQATQEQRSYGFTRGTNTGAQQLEGITDAQGHYRLDGLQTGVFSLRALSGLFGVAASGAISRDGERVRKDLILSGRLGSLKARILDASGQPLLGEALQVGFPAGLLRTAGTEEYVFPIQISPGADGWAHLEGIPAGDLRVRSAGIPTGRVTAFQGFLSPEAELSVELQLLAAPELAHARFRVIDALGRPVEKALVRYDARTEGGQYNLQTGEEGLTDLVDLVPGIPIRAVAFHPGWLGEVPGEGVVPESGRTYTLTVAMPSRGALQGRVTRPDGTPVAGAYVAVPPVTSNMSRNRLSITDAQGRYQLPNVPTGAPFRLAVVGPELRTSRNQTLQVLAEQNLRVDLELPEPGRNRVDGTVYQPQEGPNRIPAMAEVEIRGQLPSVNVSTGGGADWGLPKEELLGVQDTPPSGRFQFADLPAGPFKLSARNSFFPVGTTLADGFGDRVDALLTRDLTLVSSFSGELTGRVTQPDGITPVAPGARVTVSNRDLGELTVHTQEGGRYAFAKVIPEGAYLLRVEDPATGGIAVTTLELKRECSQVRNLRLWGRGTLRVHVRDAQGAPLPEAELRLGHARAALLNADDLPPMGAKLLPGMAGELVIEDLLEGPISVQVKTPSGLVGTASVEIPVGGGPAEATVRIQPVGGLRGLLRRADGSLVPAGRVDAYGMLNGNPDAWLGVSPTFQEGVEGRFLFYPLPAGLIRLEAWDPESRQQVSAKIDLKACPEEGPFQELELHCLDKGSVQVQVLNALSQPVPRASLRASCLDGVAIPFDTEATSDADGKGSFLLPPGRYRIEAVDPVSLATAGLEVQREPDVAPLVCTLRLQGVRSVVALIQPPPGAPDLSRAG